MAQGRSDARRRHLDRRHLSGPLHGHGAPDGDAAVRFADEPEFNAKLKAKQVPPGSVLVGGKNFGCGSSREQAVSSLKG